jgi:hypothetical protein
VEQVAVNRHEQHVKEKHPFYTIVSSAKQEVFQPATHQTVHYLGVIDQNA